MGIEPRTRLDVDTALPELRASLLKLARHVAPGVDAEDLVQEALARALERRDSFQEGTGLRAWMRPVIRNLAIDESRRRRRLRPLGDAPEPPTSSPPAEPSWAELDGEHVRRALEGCSCEQRTAFELHYWQTLSLDAIAAQLGVPRATVGTRLFRARAQVRRALERELLAEQA